MVVLLARFGNCDAGKLLRHCAIGINTADTMVHFSIRPGIESDLDQKIVD